MTGTSPARNSSCRRVRTAGGHAAVVVLRPGSPASSSRVGELLGAAPGRHVDDAACRRTSPPSTCQQPAPAVVLGRAVRRLEEEVGPVQPGDDHLGIAQPQPGGDVVAHRRRGGRGERDDDRAARSATEPSAGRPTPAASCGERVAEGQVVRPEVVPPRRQAVRLVDRDQRRAQRPDLGQPVRLGQLLRRDEQEPGPSRRAPPSSASSCWRGRLGRADPHRPGQLVPAAVEPGDLVLLQRQQRRDHHGRPAQQRRRHLVDGRLAGAGGQDDHRVAAAQQRPHRRQLGRAQPVDSRTRPRAARRSRQVRSRSFIAGGPYPVTGPPVALIMKLASGWGRLGPA